MRRDTRVLVVDDSAIVRRIVATCVEASEGFTVAGTARDGGDAVRKARALRPDAVTLDIEMPVMDGLATLRVLRAEFPALPIIMFSTLTASGAASTIEALLAGASDYVTKPSNTGSYQEAIERTRSELIPKIQALVDNQGHDSEVLVETATVAPASSTSRTLRLPSPGAVPTASVMMRPEQPLLIPDLVTIGSSTGGPDALVRLLSSLAQGCPSPPWPVAIVQHMPALFTPLLAERLARASGLAVAEAVEAEELHPGRVYVAPGGRHLAVRRGPLGEWMARLDDGPEENYCRPAVDVLFRTSIQAGATVLALVLTGMGHDGAAGSTAVADAGGEVWAQDQATSTVWGMPGAVVAHGAHAKILPLDEMGGALAHVASRSVAAPSLR